MMAVLDAGADDINLDGDTYEILTDANALSQVRENLEAAGYALISSEVDKIPATTVALDNEGVEKVQRMLNWFDDNDDVQNVYHNAELPEEEEEE
jgi:transcriptional/translational regulatory protein YebC/TACO1